MFSPEADFLEQVSDSFKLATSSLRDAFLLAWQREQPRVAVLLLVAEFWQFLPFLMFHRTD